MFARWITSAVSVLVFAGPARAQRPELGRWLIELEPLPILSSGIGVSARFVPSRASRFAIGISGVTQDVEGFAQDVVFANADALETRLTWALGVEALYFLRAQQRGFHVSATAGIEEFRARTTSAGPRLQDVRTNGFGTLQLGYVWYPGIGGLYINPRIGGITTFATDHQRSVGGTSYELERIFPSAWLRIGLRL